MHAIIRAPYVLITKVFTEIKSILGSFRLSIMAISKRDWLIIISLFIIVLFPRGLMLGRWTYIEGTTWIERSDNFRGGLISGNFEETYQMTHPGVTTMWISTIFYSLGVIITGNNLSSVDILVIEQMGHVLVVSMLTILIYALLVKVFNRTVAILSILFIAFDPYHILLSRLIYHEALVASFLMISILTIYLYLKDGKTKGYLVLSGMSAGLAFLSKITTFLLIPFIPLLILIFRMNLFSKRRNIKKKNIKKVIKEIVIWILCAFFIFFVLWPAMWVSPQNTVSKLGSASVGVMSGSLYVYNETLSTPSIFYYFTRLPFLITPIVLIYAVVTFLYLLISLKKKKNSFGLIPALIILIFTLYFVTIMSFSPKKTTWYILIYNVVMDVVAGLGLYLCVGYIFSNLKSIYTHLNSFISSKKVQKIFALSLIFLSITPQVYSSLPLCPYYSLYHNPIRATFFGTGEEYYGGNGEGLGDAARYLNKKEDARNLTVALGEGWVSNLDIFFDGNTTTVENAMSPNTDYIIFYRKQYLRGYDPELVHNYIETMEAEYIVRIRGMIFVWIYPRSTISFSNRDISVSNRNPLAGENVTITVLIQNLGDESETAIVRIYDGDPNEGGEVLAQDITITIDPYKSSTVSTIWNATPGQHKIFITAENVDPIKAVTSFDNAEIELDVK